MTTMFKAQTGSKDIIKIVHVTSVVKLTCPYFLGLGLDSCCICRVRKLSDLFRKYLNLCSEDERRSYGLEPNKREKLITEFSISDELPI